MGIPLDRVPLLYDDDQTIQIVQAFKDNPTPVAGEFISREIQFFINYCFVKEDLDFLEKILFADALPLNEIDWAIEKAIKAKKYEHQIMLIRYKEKKEGFEKQISVNERFAL